MSKCPIGDKERWRILSSENEKEKIKLILKKMGYLHRVRTATTILVKNLYWHFTGILLGLPERKDLGSFEAPVIK